MQEARCSSRPNAGGVRSRCAPWKKKNRVETKTKNALVVWRDIIPHALMNRAPLRVTSYWVECISWIDDVEIVSIHSSVGFGLSVILECPLGL